MPATQRKFQIHVPKLSALDILKGVLFFANRGKSYSCNPRKYNAFFLKASKKYPELFEDVVFDDDPFLPYSEDFERAYTSAMEFNILSRPNPDIYPCNIVATQSRLEAHVKNKFTTDQVSRLQILAKEFERDLPE